jgi:hypothetical protein
MKEWLPTARIVEHDGVTGVAILLSVVSGDRREEMEVGRVAFVRKKSENPKVKFEDQLRDLIERADAAADTVNDLWAEFDRVKELDREQRLREDDEAIDQGLAKLREAFPREAAFA